MQCTYTEEALFHHIAKFHTGKKPYNCNKCELNFSEKVLQLKHIESVHDGNKPYRCFVCNDKFPQQRKLTIHMNKKHKEVSFKTENPDHEEQEQLVHKNKMPSNYNELLELEIEAKDKVQKQLVHEEKVSLVYEEITSNYKKRITAHEDKKQHGNSYYCTSSDILG